MIVLTTKVFPAPEPRPETPMDKTSREVRERLDDEAAKRQEKVVRLRKARLEQWARENSVAVSKVKPIRKETITRITF